VFVLVSSLFRFIENFYVWHEIDLKFLTFVLSYIWISKCQTCFPASDDFDILVL